MDIDLNRLAVLLFAGLLLPLSAQSDPIGYVPIFNGSDGGTLDTYAMTAFANPAATDPNDPDDDYECIASPISGQLCFEDKYHNPEGMDASSPDWWEWDGSPAPNHSNIYTADISWIDIAVFVVADEHIIFRQVK